MKKLILFFTIIFSSNILYCQLSAVFVFDKDSIAAYSCVNELTKCKKFKNINFRIIHFNEINSNKNSFISNKMKVDVKNEKLSCDFNFCNSLEGILNSDFASSLFLYSKNSLTCTFNQVKLDEIIINNSFTNDFVKEKINYQLLNYKKNSKSTTLYFNYCNLNNNLITDRKIKNGKDTRTYKVSFNKIKKQFTNYRCRHTIQQGIEKMIKELIKLKLNKKIFYNKKFYRLQYFEYLHKRKLVDNSLKWII